ncbi:MAG: DUF2817 domain-containing protein [Candidatus Cloacimonetes bacterium]|nr:DUF2817 domain-containing protein [Candidatus Cloacimonadota bacterium]
MRLAHTIILLLMAGLIFAFPVHIQTGDADRDVKTLNTLNISIDSVNRNTGVIMAYVRDEAEYQSILTAGMDATRLPNPAPELARILNSRPPIRGGEMDDYYSFDEYVDFMQQTAIQYPELCHLEMIGSSVQGRPIYFMKISDNVAQDEPEPGFRFISSIHGDEPVGYDLLIRLIQLLTSEYGSDARITEIVDNTEIWICPMLNPDGFVAGRRFNAQNIDLNRNYPMPSGDQHPDGNSWAPENVAVMDFSQAHNFQLSTNLHGGSAVINYPWDYTFTLTPDNDLIREAALTYSRENSMVYNSPQFPEGVVNGAQWYVITGSLQDWSYGYTDCIDLTAEIGANKWPPASELPMYWDLNKESMLCLLEFVQNGVHGTVTSEGGMPLGDATIHVVGNDKVMNAGSVWGDYHRLLLPGSYTIRAEADGYIAHSRQVTVPASGRVDLDFVLMEAGQTDFWGQIRTVDGGGIDDFSIEINTNPPLTADADANGSFSFENIREGYYNAKFIREDFVFYEKQFLLTAEDNRMVFIYEEPDVLFEDAFDNMDNWTADQPWGIIHYEGDNRLTDSPSGNYANNINKSCRLTNPIDLSQIENAKLTLLEKHILETNYDFAYLEASRDGENWQQLAVFTGTQVGWAYRIIPIADYDGGDLHLRFRIQTDIYTTRDGIYIDDLIVTGYSTAARFLGDATGDRIISVKDLQAILDYSVGLDPDDIPRPWQPDLIAACDVDGSGELNSVDAFLVAQYIYDPTYRFAAQGGEEYPFTEVMAEHSFEGTGHTMTFQPANSLCALDIQLISPDEDSVWDIELDPGDVGGYVALNGEGKAFAWVKLEESLQGVQQTLTDSLAEVVCEYTLNGVHHQINWHPGTANPDDNQVAAPFALLQNYPNPFNPHTQIRFWIADSLKPSSMRIYNLKGQLVKTLFEERLEAGAHQVGWDGKDNAGQNVGSGIYLYRLINGLNTQTRRMILIQ